MRLNKPLKFYEAFLKFGPLCTVLVASFATVHFRLAVHGL